MKKLFVAAAFFAACALANAQAPATPAPGSAEHLESLRVKLTAQLLTPVKKIAASQVPGLYEVAMGPEVIYTDANANFVIMGQIFDVKTRQNLTEQAKERLNRIDFDSLPLEDAIKVVNGTGARRIAVFSDPNCGYCKKLEVSLRGLKDVTIYTFLYPVITPGSKELSANVWCQKDRSKAWLDFMLENKPVPARDPSCDISALERNVALGQSLNITGTPTVFAPNGARVPGAADPVYLEKILSGANQ